VIDEITRLRGHLRVRHQTGNARLRLTHAMERTSTALMDRRMKSCRALNSGGTSPRTSFLPDRHVEAGRKVIFLFMLGCIGSHHAHAGSAPVWNATLYSNLNMRLIYVRGVRSRGLL